MASKHEVFAAKLSWAKDTAKEYDQDFSIANRITRMALTGNFRYCFVISVAMLMITGAQSGYDPENSIDTVGNKYQFRS